MNFQKLRSVEKADFYLDIAFARAKKETDMMRKNTKLGDHPGAKRKKSRDMELKRITVVAEVLDEQFSKMIDSYPRIDELDEFYRELIRCTLDDGELKKSLGAVNWVRGRISDLYRFYSTKIVRASEPARMNTARKEFYGRVSSVVKQINKNLLYIERCRKIMTSYPSIKTGLFTVAIAGFPNVGKSTLLRKITTAKPEVASYAFTTKSLMLGYIREEGQSKKEGIQVIDTPGTLNRFDKMNDIERQAYLAIKHLAEVLVFVFDLTDEYPLAQQEKLYENLKRFDKPVMIYISKTDVLNKEAIDDFVEKIAKKYKLNKKLIFTDSAELKKEIVEKGSVKKE